jgi:hypothetical protein
MGNIKRSLGSSAATVPDIITAENFDAAAIAWVNALPSERRWHALTVDKHPIPMAAWRCYFANIGLRHRFVTLTHAISSGDAYTLPSLTPAEFDPAHAPSILDMELDARAKPPRVTPERAAQIVEAFRTRPLDNR